MILYGLSIGIICSSFLLALRIELLVDKLTSQRAIRKLHTLS